MYQECGGSLDTGGGIPGYIYFENKEAMLREIYLEHAEHRIDYLLQSVSSNMAGEEIIEQLIRRYYFFIIEHKEVFHFIEQFSACPVLQSSCGLMKESTALNQLLNDLKKRQILNNFNNDNLNAILFSSVKMIALKTCETENMAMNRLNELIYIVQKALIKDY